MKRFNRNFLATISGNVVAVANAWITIDWKNFDIKVEWPKLALSALIAAGGYLSEMKKIGK